MTKREIQQEVRREFFTQVENKYSINSIESEMGGRWIIEFKNGFQFELSNINYGGEINSFEFRGSERYDEGIRMQTELQVLWNEIYQG